MLELIILLFLAGALMARRPARRRRAFSLRRVKVTPSLALATLGSVTALTGAVTGSADGQYRAITLKGVWSMNDHTAAEGPITVGFAHSDYSVTEIKEALEASTAISLGDKVAQEQSNRLVRIVGVFGGEVDAEALNDGKPISTKLNWKIPIGKAVNIFAYNDGLAALTTGTVLRFMGDLWVKDY